MKKSIRRFVFETNSSSTHSMCVTKNNVLDQKLEYIKFSLGEFGWDYDNLRSVGEKASYLYTGILANNRDELIDNIKEILQKNDVQYDFEEPEFDTYSDGSRYLNNGGIDHSDELYDFLDICKDEDEFMRYLFSSESFVRTGNDNSGSDVDINVSYDHDEYYKGN